MAPGTKIKDLESQAPSGQHPLPVSGPVMLIALPPPAKDYLCLSITSFCFCILLAIPALMFSLKVGTFPSHSALLPQVLPRGFVHFLFTIWLHAPLVPSTPGSHLALLSLILSPSWLLLPLGTEPHSFLVHLTSPDIGLSRDVSPFTPFLLETILPAWPPPPQTREANYDGDWRRAQRNSRLALGFSVSSILVGCILMVSSVTVIFETEDMTSS